MTQDTIAYNEDGTCVVIPNVSKEENDVLTKFIGIGAEDHEGFFIHDLIGRHTIHLNRHNKIFLFHSLEQNIAINSARSGNWFMVPMAREMIDRKYSELPKQAFWVWIRLKIVKWAMKGLMT